MVTIKGVLLPLFLLLILACSITALSINIPYTDPDTQKTYTFQEYLCNTSLLSNTVIRLSSGPEAIHHFNLTSTICTITGLTNITIESRSRAQAVINCLRPSNELLHRVITFFNIEGLTITNVLFEGCGGLIYPGDLFPLNPIYYPDRLQAVLILNHCSSVQFENVTITNYYGYAIMCENLLNSTFERLNITYSRTSENSTTATDTFEHSGSGVIFGYNDTSAFDYNDTSIFGYNDTSIFGYNDTSFPDVTDTDNSIVIHSSIFAFNTNLYPSVLHNKRIRERTMYMHNPRHPPGAGGLTLVFRQTSFNVNITISKSVFRSNTGTTSGGARIVHVGTFAHSHVNIDECSFDSNYLTAATAIGAGLRILFIHHNIYTNVGYQLENLDANPYPIRISNTLFYNNTAPSGAAMALYSTGHDLSDMYITLERVQFRYNAATGMGGCIHALSERSLTFSQKTLILHLLDVTVQGAGYSEDTYEQRNAGAFHFVNLQRVLFNGSNSSQYTIIEEGENSAVTAYSTNIFLTGTVMFQNNTGSNGAAIYLDSGSYLFVLQPANIYFINNTAFNRGGAIYSEQTGEDRCIIQFLRGSFNHTITTIEELDMLQANVTLQGNRVDTRNISIDATPLYNCTWYPESAIKIPSEFNDALYKQIFQVPNTTTNALEVIRSDPVYLCICASSNDLQCNPEYQVLQPAFPGRSFSISLAAADAAKQIVSGVVRTRITSEGPVRFKSSKQTPQIADDIKLLLHSQCMEVNYTILKTAGESISVKLELNLIGVSSTIIAGLNLTDCPLGFQLNSASGSCECTTIYRERGLTCDLETGLITRQGEEWIGISYHDSPIRAVYAARCPRGYCNTVQVVNVSKNDFLCLGERTGELCGKCTDGLSQRFGTSSCGNCSHYWLFTILLYALAGILLVILLFVLKLTVTAGTINGLIFYAQMVGINNDLLFHNTVKQPLIVFISLLNLDLGFPICFYDGMDYLGRVTLQFAFPLYIWFMATGIIVLSRFSPLVQKLTSHASIQVLDTLFYLSYAKLLRSVCIAFIPTLLTTEDRNHVVWFFDGTVHYLKGYHLALGIIAAATLLFFLIPYKFSLLFAPKCLRYRRVSYFKPLIDAHLAPLKDKWRFWFGLRLFLLSFNIIVTVIFLSFLPMLVLTLHLSSTLVFAIFQAYIKPFRNKAINILDLFFLLNFCILAIAALYTLSEEDLESTLLYIATGISVGTSFIVFCGIVIYHVLLVTNTDIADVWNRIKKSVPRRKVQKVTSSEVGMDSDETRSSDDQRVDTRYWDASGSSDRLRESILAYSDI